jgi:ketosteroid isomerase-like protein
MTSIAPDQVRAKVSGFWKAFRNKSRVEFEEMYLPSATVFSSTVPRSESARLTIARRLRQFFDPKATIQMDVGDIDVQLVGNIAIASYSFRFRGTHFKSSDGSAVDHQIPCGRGTHVFKLDDRGQLRILHEHFSSGEPSKPESTVEL